MKVYLINCQDKWCPENNNGDYIIEAWSTKELAELRVKELNKKDKIFIYYVMPLPINLKSDTVEFYSESERE